MKYSPNRLFPHVILVFAPQHSCPPILQNYPVNNKQQELHSQISGRKRKVTKHFNMKLDLETDFEMMFPFFLYMVINSLLNFCFCLLLQFYSFCTLIDHLETVPLSCSSLVIKRKPKLNSLAMQRILTSNKLLFRDELSHNSTVWNMSDVVVSLPHKLD